MPSNGVFRVTVGSNTNCYYVLYRGTGLTNIQTVVQTVAGGVSSVQMQDTNALAPVSFYRVQEVSNAPAATLVSFLPTTATILPGAATNLTLGIDKPAPPGGVTIDLQLSPATAGTLPATVTVPPGASTVAFTYTDNSTVSSASIGATLGATTLNATINVSSSIPGLVINEVDYDSVGTDTLEFVELLNTSTSAVDMTGLILVFINGANNLEYFRQPLSGVLPPGGYFVMANSNVVVAAAAQKLYFTNTSDSIQNGAPDGIAIFNTVTHQLVDALSYEGSITVAQITGEGTFNLVEGMALSSSVADSNTTVGSLIRQPNGMDSNNANTDWKFTRNPTPGAANIYMP